MTLADLPIIPEHIWSKVPPEKAKEVTARPIGTGPYKLVSYNSTSGYRFSANTSYFAGKPVVRELIMPVVTDPSATFTALRSGQIDATARPLSPELIDQFTNSNTVGVLKTAPLQFPEIRLNYERAPFDQPAFRTAVSRAVNRNQLLDVVGLGKGRPSDKGYPHPDAPATNPRCPRPTTGRGQGHPRQAEVRRRQRRPSAGGTSRTTALHDLRQWRGADPRAGCRAGRRGPAQGRHRCPGQGPGRRFVGRPERVTGLRHGGRQHRSTRSRRPNPVHHVPPLRLPVGCPELPYPAWDALFERWKATTTNKDRIAVSQEMQTLFNRQPTLPACTTWCEPVKPFMGHEIA